MVLLALFAACGDGGSPTDPSGPGSVKVFDVTGAWHGDLGTHHPIGEDWSNAVVSLTQKDSEIDGTLTAVNGTSHILKGKADATTALIAIGGLPGTSECGSADLFVQGIEYQNNRQAAALVGVVQGRCYGTIMFPFRITK